MKEIVQRMKYLKIMNDPDPLHKKTPIEDLPRGSAIQPVSEEKAKVTFDDALEVVESFFRDNSYECGKNYNDGFNIELLKDDLDIAVLIASLVRIVFDQLRQSDTLSDNEKINLSYLYNSINSQLKIVKNSDDKEVAHNVILCKIIGYCLKNYQRYNNINTSTND